MATRARRARRVRRRTGRAQRRRRAVRQPLRADIAAGLLRAYHDVADDLATLRGRVDLAEQLRRRPGLDLPLAVRSTQHDVDVVENRLSWLLPGCSARCRCARPRPGGAYTASPTPCRTSARLATGRVPSPA